MCVKFDSEDVNVFYTGGWDRKVLIWDVRNGPKCAGQIDGPLISGEAIDSDSRSHKLLTGSHTKTNSLMIWDLRNLGQPMVIPWSIFKSTPSSQTQTYSCKFIQPRKCAVMACGLDQNAVKIFSATSGNPIYSFNDNEENLF